MARPIDLDQLMKYPLRRGSEHCDEKNADPRFLNGVESILEWAQTLPALTPQNDPLTIEELREMDGEPVNIINAERRIAALDIALSALRHVSREQDLEDENMELKKRIVNWRKYVAPTREKVEQVWRGECGCSKPKACCTCCSMRCRYCIGQSEYRQAAFCMKCGRPMTDEAVQMVLERMEAMYGEAKAD